jgi:ribosomal protein S18 acetylase RimI-like enzyme
METTVATRPVQPEDQTLFCRLWSRLSPETVYRRFHGPVRTLPEQTVRHLVTVDHDQREAVVAVVGGEVVGVARYDRPLDDPSTAEIALLVEDAWQGVGLGRQLLSDLTDRAARHGVRTLTATVQPDNEPVLGLLRRVLPGSTLTPEADVYTVTSFLDAAPEPVPTAPQRAALLASSTH